MFDRVITSGFYRCPNYSMVPCNNWGEHGPYSAADTIYYCRIPIRVISLYKYMVIVTYPQSSSNMAAVSYYNMYHCTRSDMTKWLCYPVVGNKRRIAGVIIDVA